MFITSLFKKGLSENEMNDIVGVINRRNGCGQAFFKKGCAQEGRFMEK
jgi:hypothetical protein